jgi:Bacterial Ig-like domain (group 2)
MVRARHPRRLAGLLLLGIASLVNGCGGSNSAATSSAGATLRSLEVTPSSAAIGVGAAQQFRAMGTYGDDSTRDLTSSVSWESFRPIVATITSGGLATGATPGTADIAAAFDQFDAIVSLNVSLTPGLQSITVSPADSTINPSESVQFIATGVFSDGSISVLTSTVTWTSSRPGVAEMAPGGLATGIQTGSTTITAISGSVSGTAMLSVNSL